MGDWGKGDRGWEEGVNMVVSTAFGMADTMWGEMDARSTVFSLDVWLTQITWSTAHAAVRRSAAVRAIRISLSRATI